MKVIGFFIRSDDEIIKRIERLVKATRLSKSDVARMCMRFGLPKVEGRMKAQAK